MNQNLLKRLQEKIKLQSVNSLGSLYPEDIIEWLGASEEETKELIDVLHSERVITYKYRIKCSCSEICVIYESNLFRGKVSRCGVCGEVFSLEDIKQRGEIIYEIDKEGLLSLEDKKTNFKVFPSIRPNIVSITQKKEEVEVMEKNEIFIGSSSGMVDYMDIIALKLEQMNEVPLLWNDESKNIFVPGTSTIDSLLEITDRVKAAIFIFNEDDTVWFNGNDSIIDKSENAVRDNVLFEYGLFMGALGKGKVCFICKGNPHIASDLQGITYINGDSGETQVKTKLKSWIARVNTNIK